MIKIKNKLLGIVDSEDDLVFNENPFVRKLMRNNRVYYFNGLFMKVWANSSFQYQTQKINECWTFTYGQSVTQLSDGQEFLRVINFESDGKRDNEGFMSFKLSESSIEIIGEDVTFYVKEGTLPNTIIVKAFVVSEDEEDKEKGEWQIREMPSYEINTEQSDSRYTVYNIAKLNAPRTGYADVWGTVGPCEGKKIYIHDEYFSLNHPESAITKLVFSKEVKAIPVGELRGLYNLTEITLPSKLKSIGYYTLSSCYSLSSLTIPSNVTFIDSDAFFGCNNLTSIYFDNNVTMLPDGAPWGANKDNNIVRPSRTIIRCRDGYYEGPIVYACLKSEYESDSYYRYCWGLDIMSGISGEKHYAFVNKNDYDEYHDDYLFSPIQEELWEKGVESPLSHVNGILYVENISGDTTDGYFTEHPIIGNKVALCLASDGLFTYYEKEGELLTYSSRTFQHYDFLDYTDNVYGPLKGYCNRIGYAPLTDEPNIQFMTRWEYDLGNESIADGYDIVNPYEPLEYYYIKQDDSDSYRGLNFIFKGYVDIYSDYNVLRPRVNSSNNNIQSTVLLLRNLSFVEGNMIAKDNSSDWFPLMYKRFEVLDITIGNKTYYAFCEADKVDRYMQEYSGDSFDVDGISIFTSNADFSASEGYNGREYDMYEDVIIYTDSLNSSTAYAEYGYLNVSTDGDEISYGISGTKYEPITISGNSMVSALTISNGSAVQSDEDEDEVIYYNYVRNPSKDKVIGDVTYYNFNSTGDDCYLTDISEGTKMRAYKQGSSSMSPLSDKHLYFISGSTPIENVTENSGNTLTIRETYENESQLVSCHYFEAYNEMIGDTTFYAYIPHDAYRTAYRVLSTEESGITEAKDDRLLSAICNENKHTGMIKEHNISIIFLTDISQGSKVLCYLGQYSATDSQNLEFRFNQAGKYDISNSSTQIVVSDNPNLDNDIAYEIEHMEDYQSDNYELLSDFITHKNWIVRASSNGESEIPVRAMTLNYNTYNYNCVRFEPYDFERNGVHYYAFIDKICYDAISGVVGYIVDVTDSEFVKRMIGSIEMVSADYDTLITTENNMDIIYLTSIGQTNSILSCYAYKMGISVEADDETGDSYIMKGLLSEGTEATANMTTINYAFAIEMDSEEDL